MDYAPLDRTGTEPVAEAGLGALVRRHWLRFTSFSLIGGLIFVVGLALQARRASPALTERITRLPIRT